MDKVLPLQDGSEAALQRDDSPQDLLVKERLETLTLGLSQEHLRMYRYASEELLCKKTHASEENRYHCVAHLIPGRREMAPPEELPDAGLGWGRAVRHQHMKVAHKVLQQEHHMEEV